jgi:citrate synthase
MSTTGEIILEGKSYKLPIVTGTENEKAVDISKLRQESGYITIDSGYGNTGACKSAITFIDGDLGILRYRGIPIEELAEKSDFVETSYLLIYGHLPNRVQREEFRNLLSGHAMIHEGMIQFFDGYPTTAHPMAILSAMVCSLSSYYPEHLDPSDMTQVDHLVPRLLSKMRTIAAYSYKKSKGQPVIYPKGDMDYCSNFLRMMFATPAEEYQVDPDMVKALNVLLILHADHEQNCSTSTVRLVGSSDANLFASIAAGICALWGPKHGGANQEVVEMLELIHRERMPVKEIVRQAKDKNSGFRLMGFGHRVYKNFDPRAKVIKAYCDRLLAKKGISDPLLDIAKELEETALQDDFFKERKLYPNVDFYSGVIYRAMGIPTDMFTVMFALGRLPGWIAHWIEMHRDGDGRIGRPRQVYMGETLRPYLPMDQRQS